MRHHIPKIDLAIKTGARQPTPVRADGQRRDHKGGAGQDCVKFVGAQPPQPNVAIVRTHGQSFTGGMAGQGHDAAESIGKSAFLESHPGQIDIVQARIAQRSLAQGEVRKVIVVDGRVQLPQQMQEIGRRITGRQGRTILLRAAQSRQ